VKKQTVCGFDIGDRKMVTVKQLFRERGTLRTTHRTGLELKKTSVFRHFGKRVLEKGSYSGLVRGGDWRLARIKLYALIRKKRRDSGSVA